MLLSDAVQGSPRDALVALRDRLAAEIDDGADARTLPALSKQLADVIARIEALPEYAVKSRSDELRERREKRRAKAAGE